MDFIYMMKYIASAVGDRLIVLSSEVTQYIKKPGVLIVDDVIQMLNEAIDGLFQYLQMWIYNLLIIPLSLFTIFGSAVDLFAGITTYDYVEKVIRVVDEHPQGEYDSYLVWDSLVSAHAFVEHHNGTMQMVGWVIPDVIHPGFREDMKKLWDKMPQTMMFNDSTYINNFINVYRNKPDRIFVVNGYEMSAADVHDEYKNKSYAVKDYGIDFNHLTTPQFRDWYFNWYLYGNDKDRGMHLVSNEAGRGLRGTYEYSYQRWNTPNRLNWEHGYGNRDFPITTHERGFYYTPPMAPHLNQSHDSPRDIFENIPLTTGDTAMRKVMTEGEWNNGNSFGWPGYGVNSFGVFSEHGVRRNAVIHNIFHHQSFLLHRYYTYKIEIYYPAKEIWKDYIQHIPGVVDDWNKPLNSRDRYSETFLELIDHYGVAAGSDAMYRRIANKIIAENPLQPNQYEVERYTLLEIFLGQNAVSFVFWAVTLISLAFCIGFSIIAVIRSIGDGGAKQPLSKTIGGIAKAMLTFLLIPALVIATINVSSVLLQQLDHTMSAAHLGQLGVLSDTSSVSSLNTAREDSARPSPRPSPIPSPSPEPSPEPTPEPLSITIQQNDAVADIQQIIQDAIEDNDVVTVTGSKTNVTSGLTLNIPAGKKLEWRAVYEGNAPLMGIQGGGIIEIASGSLITTSGDVISSVSPGLTINVTGGIVRATDGNAFRNWGANNLAVTVTGGLVFAHGSQINGRGNVIDARPAFTGATGSGVVIAWDQAAGTTQYELGSTTHISVSNGTAFWVRHDDKAGIAYADSEGSGFIDIPSVTILSTSISEPGAVISNSLLGSNPGFAGLGRLTLTEDNGGTEDMLETAQQAQQTPQNNPGDAARAGRQNRIDVPTAIVISAITPESLIDPNPHNPWSADKRSQEHTKLINDLTTGRLHWANLDILKRVNVFKMYFLPALVAAWFSVFIIIMILLIFIRRIFELVMLYITAPFFVAPMPLDDGAKFKAWKDAFIGKAISGFASILMLRLFLIFVPIIWSSGIAFSTDAFADILLKVLFMVGGMYTVYKSHTLITGLVSQSAGQADKESSTGMVGHFTVGTVSSGLQQAASGAVSTIAGKPFNLANSHLDKMFMAKKGGGGSPLDKLGNKNKSDTKFSGKTERNETKPLDSLPPRSERSAPPSSPSQPKPSSPPPQSSQPSSSPSSGSSGQDDSPKTYKPRIIKDPGNLPPMTQRSSPSGTSSKHFGSAGPVTLPEEPISPSGPFEIKPVEQKHTGNPEGL